VTVPGVLSDTCEVLINGTWTLISLAEAHTRHRKATKRSPSCHGQVATQGTYGARQGVFMNHRRKYDGCPRMPSRFAGTPRMHPDPLTQDTASGGCDALPTFTQNLPPAPWHAEGFWLQIGLV